LTRPPRSGAHGIQQVLGILAEGVGIVAVGLDHLREDAVRQQADILGEEAEDDLDEEVGGLLRVFATGVEAGGDLAEPSGGGDGDGIGRVLWPEALGVGPEPPEHREVAFLGEAGEVDLDDLLDGVGEIGVDADDVEVADDEQGRIAEVVLVAEELDVGGVEVLADALVLPGDVAVIPNVRPAIAATGDFGAALEGVGLAGRVLVEGFLDAEELAEVVEVGDVGAAFLLARGVDPLALKGENIHRLGPVLS
jgi:hypothetical protein